MSNFWLTKKMVLEALKLSEGEPQTTFIAFEGRSEIKNGIEQTVMTIHVGDKKKTIREDFNKLQLANNETI